jgi:hypothetical protein
VQVAHRGGDAAVAEQSLQGGQIAPGFQEMRGEGVAQRVNGVAPVSWTPESLGE